MKNNVKIAYVRSDDIVKAFFDSSQRFITKLRLIGVPEDTKVVYGWYDARRNCFGIRLYHETFELIPDNDIPPVVASEIEMVVIREGNHG